MTPAINAAKKAGVTFNVHQYTHDRNADSYGAEAAEKLGLPADRVFKTLLAQLDGKELVVAVIPVNRQLDLKRLAATFGAKTATMAAPADAERSSGYVVGGISPLGQKKRLRTAIDHSALALSTLYVSAGRRGLEIELAPQALQLLTAGTIAELYR